VLDPEPLARKAHSPTVPDFRTGVIGVGVLGRLLSWRSMGARCKSRTLRKALMIRAVPGGSTISRPSTEPSVPGKIGGWVLSGAESRVRNPPGGIGRANRAGAKSDGRRT
jgi:hypothetical protein